jgi:hypothetical protein
MEKSGLQEQTLRPAARYLKAQPAQPGFAAGQVAGLQLAAADHVADIGRPAVGFGLGRIAASEKQIPCWCIWYKVDEPVVQRDNATEP